MKKKKQIGKPLSERFANDVEWVKFKSEMNTRSDDEVGLGFILHLSRVQELREVNNPSAHERQMIFIDLLAERGLLDWYDYVRDAIASSPNGVDPDDLDLPSKFRARSLN